MRPPTLARTGSPEECPVRQPLVSVRQRSPDQTARRTRAFVTGMRTLASFTLISSLLASLAPAATAAPPPSIDRFGAKLHAEVGKQRGNLVYSPASIALALAMTREGARATTATEMDAVLGAGARAEARALLATLAKPAGKPQPDVASPPELSIANRLFGELTMPFDRSFVELTRDGYGAPIEGVDFKHHPEEARAKVNAWVEHQTKARIKNLLAKGTIDNLTRLVLVNAIYLKAQWMTPAKFMIEGTGGRQVSTMRTEAPASWGDHAGARMLDLPYVAGPGRSQLSMLLVVPDSAKLDAIEAAYSKTGLAPFLAATTSHGKVNVALPKFKIGTDLDLGASLAAMGMKRAFTDQAEFPGISEVPTKISKAIHKAWVQVDEKGTEAAAATAIVMTEITAVDPTPVHDFPVDRSFVFFIHDQDGTVLFGGRVVDPR
jgi:serpin B